MASFDCDLPAGEPGWGKNPADPDVVYRILCRPPGPDPHALPDPSTTTIIDDEGHVTLRLRSMCAAVIRAGQPLAEGASYNETMDWWLSAGDEIQIAVSKAIDTSQTREELAGAMAVACPPLASLFAT